MHRQAATINIIGLGCFRLRRDSSNQLVTNPNRAAVHGPAPADAEMPAPRRRLIGKTAT